MAQRSIGQYIANRSTSTRDRPLNACSRVVVAISVPQLYEIHVQMMRCSNRGMPADSH